ncbi:MAG: MurR/RpiR family transcriptional regulator [Eubacteriales bacterium]|nr:MurR/RpiR family transcriptional regulator [Eubacteriales bacterium]
MGIVDTIRQEGKKLTKKQKMVADYMMMHPDEMAYLTLKDLSRRVGVTEITILNACQALGYGGLNDVKYEFRKELIIAEKTDVLEEKNDYNETVPAYELTDREQFLHTIGVEEIAQLEDYWSKVDVKRIFEAAELFFSYRRIILCGRGFSYLTAELLKNYLSYADIFTATVNTELNDSTYSLIAGVGKDTLIVAISFPDYYFMTTKLAKYAMEAKAKLLVITDREDAELAQYADFLLTVPTTTRCFLNTLSPVMMLMNLLGSALNILQSEKKARERERRKREIRKEGSHSFPKQLQEN